VSLTVRLTERNERDMDSREDLVTQIQMLYPRIYMACHVDHMKARSSESKISARDSAILAHLSSEHFRHPGILAKHLDITPSTLSEALHHLVSLGYVTFKTNPDDERKTEFKLTDSGITAMKNASVLDSKKVIRLLERLSAEDCRRAVEGLVILAEAAIKD
jgi:DNA-binding MarR family transcriptional regulator